MRHVFGLAALAIAGCSVGASPGDPGAGGAPECEEVAPVTDAGLPPDAASGECPPGFWMNRGEACGPFGGECGPTGDGLCYQLCLTTDDCADPCAHSCTGLPFYGGGDTPAGIVPVCDVAEPKRFPARCELALRACGKSCGDGGLIETCAMDCWDQATTCAYEECHPVTVACYEECALTPSDDAERATCEQACAEKEIECRGP